MPCSSKELQKETLKSEKYVTENMREVLLANKNKGEDKFETWVNKRVAKGGQNVLFFQNMLRIFDLTVTVDDINRVWHNFRLNAKGTQLSKEKNKEQQACAEAMVALSQQ